MRLQTLVFLLTAAVAGSAQAQDKTSVAEPTPAVVAPVAPQMEPDVITDGELATLNGRQGSTTTVLSDQDLTAVNRGNTITATTVGSGPITLGPGAFDGFAGVGNFVINSGHNNNLQGALTINIVVPQ